MLSHFKFKKGLFRYVKNKKLRKFMEDKSRNITRKIEIIITN